MSINAAQKNVTVTLSGLSGRTVGKKTLKIMHKAFEDAGSTEVSEELDSLVSEYNSTEEILEALNSLSIPSHITIK